MDSTPRWWRNPGATSSGTVWAATGRALGAIGVDRSLTSTCTMKPGTTRKKSAPSSAPERARSRTWATVLGAACGKRPSTMSPAFVWSTTRSGPSVAGDPAPDGATAGAGAGTDDDAGGGAGDGGGAAKAGGAATKGARAAAVTTASAAAAQRAAPA